MPSCSCPVKSCGRQGSWCIACCRGIPISASFSACCPCCGAEKDNQEVGVWTLRYPTASKARKQEGEKIMGESQFGASDLLPRKQNRENPFAQARSWTAIRPRNLRLFKD